MGTTSKKKLRRCCWGDQDSIILMGCIEYFFRVRGAEARCSFDVGSGTRAEQTGRAMMGVEEVLVEGAG